MRKRSSLASGHLTKSRYLAGLQCPRRLWLLVPTLIVFFGLETPEAAGTSLAVSAAVTVPTLVTHAVIGDIVWAVALPFSLGIVPGTILGARLAGQLPAGRMRKAFGALVVVFATWFLATALLAG